MKQTTKRSPVHPDQPIPFLVSDLPIPYRVRVATPSEELRSFIVPVLNIQPVPTITTPIEEAAEDKSGIRIKVA